MLFLGICWNDWYSRFSWEDSLYFPNPAICQFYLAIILFSCRKNCPEQQYIKHIGKYSVLKVKALQTVEILSMLLYVSKMSRVATNNVFLLSNISNDLLVIFYINQLIIWSMKCHNFTVTYSPRWSLKTFNQQWKS